MNLSEKLLSIPQRENAGSRSANRFNYQQVWAFNHMLELLKENADFLLFMEFHDDIIVLDNTTNPQFIDFYQIKTDDKASRYISSGFITKNADKYPDKMSIAQKMVFNYSKFSSETRSIHLVSNKHFDFGELKCGDKSTERAVVGLHELVDAQLIKLKQGMCQSCHLEKQGCMDKCLNIIYFDVSFLDLVNYEETVLGKFINHLTTMGIESSLSKTKTLFHTILGEIKRVNNWESKAYDIAELVQRKAISQRDLVCWINQLRVDMPDNLWDDIKQYLLHDGFSSLQVNKIGKAWRKYQIDSMNIEDLTLQTIKTEIQKNVADISFENSKEFAEHVFAAIKDRKDVRIYPKEYIYAAIVKELFS